MKGRSLILAIEAAIMGGSLSLLAEDGAEIARWISEDDRVARAEHLVVQIDDLLLSAGASRNDLRLITASAGPGSFTGIRIGLATAMGLAAGLEAEMLSVSALHAIASLSEAPNCTAVVPMGRNSVCAQSFLNGRPSTEPFTLPLSETIPRLAVNGNALLMHSSLAEEFRESGRVVDIGSNIAKAIGAFALLHPGIVSEPLFVSKNF
jgi:tRNA threonylcarbamoyl adenosine modification protein YeaZ